MFARERSACMAGKKPSFPHAFARSEKARGSARGMHSGASRIACQAARPAFYPKEPFANFAKTLQIIAFCLRDGRMCPSCLTLYLKRATGWQPSVQPIAV